MSSDTNKRVSGKPGFMVQGPETDNRLQYLTLDGTRPMTGNFDVGGKDVVNVRFVDGVKVSTHAARHAPGGPDALSTAAPVTIAPDQTNAEGTTASFARADHVHNVPTAAPINIGTANSQGTSTSFARADHVHQGLHSVTVNGGVQKVGDVNLVDGIGTRFASSNNNLTVDTTIGANEFAIISINGLVVGYSAGKFVNGATGTASVVPSGTVTVPQNATSYLFISRNTLSMTPNVVISTSPPDVSTLPIASFSTNSVGVLSYTDLRRALTPVLAGQTLLVQASGTGLTVTYNSGRVRINGITYLVSSGSLTLAANISNGIIYVDTTGVVVASTATTFPANTVPMAVYSTNATSVTALSSQTTFVNPDFVFGAASDIVTILPDAVASAGTSMKAAMADHTHAIVADPAITVGTNTVNAEGTSAAFARADHTHKVTVFTQTVITSTSTATTGTTPLTITGLTITPAAGTYEVDVSCGVQTPGGGNYGNLGIYVAGTLSTGSNRTFYTANAPAGSVSTFATVTVNGSQTIDARLYSLKSGQNVQVLDGSLRITQVG